MRLDALSEDDMRVIGECLRAVASGRIIEDDWEFPTLFGIAFAELAAVAASWPDVDTTDPVVEHAVRGSLGNLAGYPHGRDDVLAELVSVHRREFPRILQAIDRA